MVESGLKDKEIAEAINITPKTICEWKKDSEFRQEYEEMMRTTIAFSCTKALRKQIELLDHKNGMIAHNAAKDLLNRGGFNPTDKVEISGQMEAKNPFADLTTEELKKLIQDG